MAAAAAAGTRRVVIRSSKFVEWQRELGSHALYGGHWHQDDGSTKSVIHYQRKRCSNARVLVSVSAPRNAPKQTGGHADAIRLTEQDTKSKLESGHFQHEDKDQATQEIETSVCCKRSDEGLNGNSQATEMNEQDLLFLGQQYAPEPKLVGKPLLIPQQGQVQHGKRPIFRRRRNACSETSAPLNSLKSNACTKHLRRSRRLVPEECHPPPLKLPKLEIVLSHKEIQEDWLKMTGHRYIGKPKKSSLVQKGLDLCTSLTCPSTIQYLHCP